MSASEATFWLRHFLACVAEGEDLTRYGTHSCKPTVLTWIGRCPGVWFSQAERRVIGHHLTPNGKSVETYSRESYTALFGKVLILYRQIREFEFDPDLNALQAADLGIEVQQPVQGQDLSERPDGPECVDSESSVASEHDFPIDDHADFTQDGPSNDLSDFPCMHLVVHRVSKVMHVINEDDTFACGRNSSRNYQALSELEVPASSFEPAMPEGCDHHRQTL